MPRFININMNMDRGGQNKTKPKRPRPRPRPRNLVSSLILAIERPIFIQAIRSLASGN